MSAAKNQACLWTATATQPVAILDQAASSSDTVTHIRMDNTRIFCQSQYQVAVYEYISEAKVLQPVSHIKLVAHKSGNQDLAVSMAVLATGIQLVHGSLYRLRKTGVNI